DGDVAAAINTAFDRTGVDILLGIGGAPEGVITAAALKCLGGEIQGKLTPKNDEEIARCKKMGIEDLDKVYYMDDFCSGDDAIFAATGVTDGELLKGVQFKGESARTETVVMRAKSGTIRFIDGQHSLQKKPNLVMESCNLYEFSKLKLDLICIYVIPVRWKQIKSYHCLLTIRSKSSSYNMSYMYQPQRYVSTKINKKRSV